MPRSGQIIPAYIHPHDEVFINDNTEYRDYTDDTSGLRVLCAFPSSKGRDKLQLYKNFGEWVQEYGVPNYRVYGQSTYMPYVLLSTGLAEVQCLRVVAKDATYANLILCVNYKREDNKLKLKFEMFSRTGLRNIQDLETVANSMERTTEDSEGYKRVPIMTFWSLGRGVYGTDFRIRISHDKAADKSNNYKNYNIDVLSTENGAATVENFNVTFYIDGTDPLTNVTNYIEDVVSDEDGNGSQKIAMQFFSDNYQTLFDTYSDIYYSQGAEVPDVQQVDRLPAITLPASNVIYNLTQADGAKAAGMYVYDATAGLFVSSAYTISEVSALMVANTADTNVIYKLTADDGSRVAGTMWVSDGTQWLAAPAIIDCTKLPSTTIYTPGVVYELTTDDGAKAAGTQWIYNATANDFIAYVAPEPEEVEPMDYDISTWDMFGYNRFTKEEDPYIVIDGGTESVAILDLEGVALMNGSDGSLAEDQPASVREAALEEALIDAYSGVTDKMILSKRRTPVDVVFDSNFSVNVKKQMVSLTTKRADFMLHLDMGLLQTTVDLTNLNVALGTIDSYLVSKDSGMMYTMDPITGKNIPVSITLWMANAYPVHVGNYGWHTPFAGERYATITGYSNSKTVKPAYDEELDADILEELYVDNRINYILSVDENTFVRGTQITSQSKTSDLSKENNVMLTLEIKRKIERMISQNRYNWTEESDIKNFKEDCQQVFSSYAGNKCKSLDIDVRQSAWEKTRYILHAYMAVVFRTYQERGIVEIDLNPRA